MSYYQKYRPAKIAELDLDSVRDVLLSSMKNGTLSHAYLFVGPRGAGKTSAARILSQVVSCKENEGKSSYGEPCGQCDACKTILNGSAVDVIEMDAASHRGIDDIRDLKDKIRLSPVSLPKKIYIIDEVHMLTNEAFNALLKTLEEPPKHAMFFLCTTEAHKVPETIVSRCTRVNFKKASTVEIVRSLNKAVAGEKLKIEDGVLELIALSTDGSFREGHKLLEQLASFGQEISKKLASEVLGRTGTQTVLGLIMASLDGDNEKIVAIITDLENSGVKASTLLLDLVSECRTQMEQKMAEPMVMMRISKILERLIDASEKIKVSPLPLLPIELALFSFEKMPMPIRTAPTPVVEPKREDKIITEEKKSLVEIEIMPEAVNEVVAHYDGPLADLQKVKNEWQSFLTTLAPTNQSLAGLLRSASPVNIEGKDLTIEVFYPFHRDQLEQDARRKVIENAMAKIWGPMNVRCVLGEKRKPSFEESVVSTAPSTGQDGVVSQSPIKEVTAEDIFGV